MKLQKSDVEHIALLARIALTEEEKERYTEELSGIFGYVELLNEVDISAVEETSQVTGLQDLTREDIALPQDEETTKKLIAAFPQRFGVFLQVPGVFTEPEE